MNAPISSARNRPLASLSDLVLAEQVLLYIVRKRVETLGPVSHMRTIADLHEVYLGVFGIAHIESALAAVEGLVSTLYRHTRRSIRFHRTKCDPVSMDEWRLLSLVAAHQAEHDEYAAAITRWLVPASHAGELAHHAAALARTMAEKELFLPLHFGAASYAGLQTERGYTYPEPMTIQ